MAAEMPVGELHAGFSGPGATSTDSAGGRRHIDEAEVFWLSTVLPMLARTSPRCWLCARRRNVLLHGSGRA